MTPGNAFKHAGHYTYAMVAEGPVKSTKVAADDPYVMIFPAVVAGTAVVGYLAGRVLFGGVGGLIGAGLGLGIHALLAVQQVTQEKTALKQAKEQYQQDMTHVEASEVPSTKYVHGGFKWYPIEKET